MIEFNKKFNIIAKNAISKASGFLFTFGLSEVWSPRNNPEIVLNQVPIKSIISDNSLWSSRFASVAEVFQSISKLVKIIRKYFGLNFPIIFTLSPVPLKYTSLGVSIREANNISKSTILVALHEICREDKNVFYYPSYEIIQAFVEKDFFTWQKDGRHITAAAINIIVQKFVANYDIRGKPKIEMSDFWVPFVNEKGEVSGRLYVDGSVVKS
ncbi:MAG: GSCFA domain-containing protein [Patescibacteria group bacterium]|nr:GSCFA domain-containing protein [Patescibacteria group bacterium]